MMAAIIATIIITSSLATSVVLLMTISRLVLTIINHSVNWIFRVNWSFCAHWFYRQLTREFSACPS